MFTVARNVTGEVVATIGAAYADTLAALPFKPATRGALLDGFKDGAATGFYAGVHYAAHIIKGEDVETVVADQRVTLCTPTACPVLGLS